MAVTVRDPHDTQAAVKDAAASSTSGLSQSALDTATASVIGDLNSDNYAAAWNTALGTSSAYGTNYNSQTKDPLLAAMESSTGLKTLDPSKQWDATQTANYYSALGNTASYKGTAGSASLGQNPYGLWGNGSASALAGDAKTNMATAGDNSAPDVARFAGATPSKSFLSKYGADIAAVVATVATAGAGAPLLAAAAAGTAASVAANAAAGNATTFGSVGKAALSSAIGAAIPGVSSYVGAAVADATGSTAATLGSEAAVGAAGGALRGEISGGNVGLDAALGGAQGLISGTNLKGTVSNAAGGGVAGNLAGSAATGLAGYGAQAALGSALGSSSGSTNGMMTNLGNLGGQQLASGGAGLIGAGLGIATAGNIGNMQQNAYTTAGNAANYLPYNTNSSSGMGASFTNGNANINYGNLTGAQNQFAQFANQQSGYANSLNGQNPYAVQQAGNTAQSAINAGMNANYNSANSGMGLAQYGLNQVNSPLVQQAQGNAQSLLGSAGANYQSAYNTSLNSQLAAMNPAIQQQSNALLNSEFERGQAGTSGGALQTQALQNSFNQADLQAQGNAVSQANALMGTTYNAANTASGIATNNQAAGTNMYNVGNNAYTSGYNNAAALGQQGTQLQQNLAAFAPQLAGMYNTNAANATSAAGNINTQGLQNGQFGLALGTNQANQMNNAAKTQGSIATAYNGGTTGALGSAFSSLGGLLQGGNSSYGGLLNSIFGGSGSTIGQSVNAGYTGGGSSNAVTGQNYLGSYDPTQIDNSSLYNSSFANSNYDPIPSYS